MLLRDVKAERNHQHIQYLARKNGFFFLTCVSSVSSRLLDEFGDGLGVAQAISYVDPQFLTYMALEERLAQAMEVMLFLVFLDIRLAEEKHDLNNLL